MHTKEKKSTTWPRAFIRNDFIEQTNILAGFTGLLAVWNRKKLTLTLQNLKHVSYFTSNTLDISLQLPLFQFAMISINTTRYTETNVDLEI